jgi:predicted Rossmann fold nucleotide-binding protein DprA/Smf involved in DNA uptake
MENESKVYVVIGSRGITDYKLVKLSLDKLKILRIVSGGAIGADTLAARYAKERNIPIIEFKPDYARHGRTAPLVRDRLIVDEAEEIVAFWDGNSRGTKYTIDYARTMNKPVMIFMVE